MRPVRYYADPDHCQTVLVATRWPKGVTCPTRGSALVGYITTRRLWECRERHPRRQFSVKVGTIFEDSPLGMGKWLPAVWTIANCKNGIGSHELGRTLGVTQKTASCFTAFGWRCGRAHSRRCVVVSRPTRRSSVARRASCTKIGRQPVRRVDAAGCSAKTAVMGLLERNGPDKTSMVRGFVVSTTRKGTLAPKVRENVAPGSEIITDALRSYDALEDTYTHKVSHAHGDGGAS